VLAGFFHTNIVECHFALLKRGVFGTFHNIGEAHLRRYLAEFGFRANTRNRTDDERAALLLVSAQGKRLLHRQPDKPRTPKQLARAFLRWRKLKSTDIEGSR
jgi:hypothetical protein